MNKQMTLSGLADELTQTATSKKEFLKQIDRIMPWSEWLGIIKPFYYKGERGNKTYELELMLPDLFDAKLIHTFGHGDDD